MPRIVQKSLYKQQRVGIFIDVQNLYYSAKHLYKAKVNYNEVMRAALRDRALIRATAYVVRASLEDEATFFYALEHIGFEVKSKDLQVFPGGMKKGDWDVGISMDAIELAPKIDVVVLVSGDGDYIPLLQHLKRALGCRTEVMAFGKSTSSKLKEEADEFIDMDSKKFLLK